MARELDVRPSHAADLPILALSGGNQQKVLMGRAALQQPDVYVLCEPTRGVDVATRRAIYRFIDAVRSEGAAVVVVTIDVDDALAVADRVAIVERGRLEAPVARDHVDPNRILERVL
jgi:ABC-type sugar transport system ATPase subunit